VLDRLAFRLFGVPGAPVKYEVGTVRIPMRDSVELGADLYRPADPIGTLLVRGPYGRGRLFSLLAARLWAARGYRVLFVSSRGTYDSAGEFDPMRDEAADGQDVVAWMREQPWFAGAFATVGTSYLGFTQWALLDDPPPELVAAVVCVGPHDFGRHTWGTGAFNLDFVGWTNMIVRAREGKRRSGRGLRAVLDGLPLADAADAHFRGRAPWFRYRATHPDLSDPYWARMQYEDALDRVTVPVLLIGGWQDLFLNQTMQQYARLHARGLKVALTVGPWTHLQVVTRGGRVTTAETLDWLDEHAAGRAGSARKAPVRIFVTGAAEWRDLPEWPPKTIIVRAELPEIAGHFAFNPADPTPSVGGPLLEKGGVVDDRALTARPDVLTVTGEPLENDLTVLGAPEVELDHRTDNPHADLFVRISDVDPRGRSHNVTEGYLRLDPRRDPGPVRLTLRPTAHRFRAGHRIRLVIAGGSHPQYARNLGTGENPGTGSALKAARHTIDPDGSSLRLPVEEA